MSRFDRRSSEKRKSRRSGEERSGSGERSSTTTTSTGGGARKTSTHSKTSSTTSAMSKLIQSASNSTSSQSKLSSTSTTSKASPAPSAPVFAHKEETTDTSRLEATDRRLSGNYCLLVIPGKMEREKDCHLRFPLHLAFNTGEQLILSPCQISRLKSLKNQGMLMLNGEW